MEISPIFDQLKSCWTTDKTPIYKAGSHCYDNKTKSLLNRVFNIHYDVGSEMLLAQ